MTNILNINSQAIRCIANGECKKAAVVLRSAIGESLQHFRSEETNEGSEQEDCGRVFLRPVPVSGSNLCLTMDCSSISLYDRAFDVVAPNQTTGSHSDDYVPDYIFVAAILYNTALTFHLMGMSNENSQALHLKKAITFYQTAAQVLQEYEDACGDDVVCDDSFSLLCLAVSNNMGHICAHYFDLEGVQECLNDMRYTLRGWQCDDDLSLEYAHFYMNMSLAQDNVYPIAPAA